MSFLMNLSSSERKFKKMQNPLKSLNFKGFLLVRHQGLEPGTP